MPMLYAHSSFWTAQDMNTMEQMNNVRTMVRHAEENHELVKGVKAMCDSVGLLEKDFLMVLVCNLIEKYDEHMLALQGAHAALQQGKATLENAPKERPAPTRKIVQVLDYPTTEARAGFKVLCDDGTIWMHGGSMGWGCVSADQIS